MTTRLVTQEEQSLRRQHLELLLAAARIAAMQNNAAAYTQALQFGRAMARTVFRRTARPRSRRRARRSLRS